MTVAGEIAAFVTRQSYADLPPKAIEHAEMLISSTIASASLGSTIESSRIIRALELERGGKPEATLWFGAAEKLPVAAAARVNALMSDAAASDDSDLRNIVHAGTTACATSLAVAEKTGASGPDVLAAIVLGYEVAGRINGAMIGGLQKKGFHGCIVASFAGAVAAGTPDEAEPAANGAGHRPHRDFDGWAARRGQYQRRARVSRRTCRAAGRKCGAGGPIGLRGRGEDPRDQGRLF